MDNNSKKMTSGILPDIKRVNSLEDIKAFSILCEATCSNLFAFSPFSLNIESEEFLHYQSLADELKERISDGCSSFGILCNLCVRLNRVYEGLMNSCWNAFIEDSNIDGEPGKFIVEQMVIVRNFNDSIG
ncbi:MAG: hypothetical protein J6U58_00015 [Bacteroidaceae bacterium]|nr:hypothetical protein [Bacteroidaceae bacterium]